MENDKYDIIFWIMQMTSLSCYVEYKCYPRKLNVNLLMGQILFGFRDMFTRRRKTYKLKEY